MLLIRVDFADAPGNPIATPQEAVDVFERKEGVREFFRRASYGKVELILREAAVTKVLRMPKSAAAYVAGGNMHNMTVSQDALQLARSAGQVPSDYQRYIIVYPKVGFIFAGVAGGETVQINGEYSFKVVAHEIGHTFGMFHASSWIPDNAEPAARGRHDEYGDPFDFMGRGSDFACDINPWFKKSVGWLGPSSIRNITCSGTYRLFRFDHQDATLDDPERPLTLQIQRNGEIVYSIGYRQNSIGQLNVDGAYVLFGRNRRANTYLLDMNDPRFNTDDAILRPGAGFMDSEASISVRVAGRGGELPHEYLDLEVVIPDAIDLAEALDRRNESEDEFRLVSNSWSGVSRPAHDGSDAARSGTLSDGESSSLEATVSGPGVVTFWWRVSSEVREDVLALFLDGTMQASISGAPDWQHRALRLPAGPHRIEWRYTKSTATTEGADCGWVDELQLSKDDTALKQTISFADNGLDKPFSVPFRLAAEASSGLPVTFSVVSGNALISGDIVTPLGPGPLIVRAIQGGNDLYLPAISVEREVLLSQAYGGVLGADLPDMNIPVGGKDWRRVFALARQSDGKLIVCGYFDSVAGRPRKNIARFLPDGSVDEQWKPGFQGRDLVALVVRDNDLFVAGDFTEVNGVPRQGLAKVSLAGAGELDTAWNPAPVGPVSALAATDAGLVVAGIFARIGGAPMTRLARLDYDASGRAQADWHPMVNGGVSRILVMGTNLFVAGPFSEVGGLPRRYLAKIFLEGAGDPDPGWRCDVASSTILTLATDGTNLFAGGSWCFESENMRHGLACISLSDGTLLRVAYPDKSVRAIAFASGHLYSAFGHDTANPSASHFVERLSADTLTRDPAWYPHLISSDLSSSFCLGDVYAVLASHEDVYVAGDFVSVGGSPGSGVALVPELVGPPSMTGAVTLRDRQSTSGLTIHPHSTDVGETTHYKISGIHSGALFMSDGVTPVLEGSYITRAAGAAGLRFTPEPGFFGSADFFVRSSLRSAEIGLGGQAARALIKVLEETVPQTIAFPTIPSPRFGDPPIALEASATSGLQVEFRVQAGPADVRDHHLWIDGAGSVTLEAFQNGNDVVKAATPVIQVLQVQKARQTLSFEPLADLVLGAPSVVLAAESTSGLPVSFRIVSGPVEMRAGYLVPTGGGEVVVEAFQDGNGDYDPAPSLRQSFRVRYPPPGNDGFAARRPLVGGVVEPAVDNRGATCEPGEPAHAAKSTGATVWWTWSAPGRGSAILTTAGTDFGTLLAVYTGNAMDQLAAIVVDANQDEGIRTSQVQFTTDPGKQYNIVVDGIGGATGRIQLGLQYTPDSPALSILPKSNSVQLRWPAPNPGFRLERTTIVEGNWEWREFEVAPIEEVGWWNVEVTATVSWQFFRLNYRAGTD